MIGAVMRIDLIKYQALGNDYLVLDLPGPLDDVVPLLPVLCDRHRGLGSDGLLAFDPVRMAVRIFNPDSSEAQKSGNGLRITAAHAVFEHGAGNEFEVASIGRSNPVRVLARNGAEVVTELDIGHASFRAADLPARFEGEPDRVAFVTAAAPFPSAQPIAYTAVTMSQDAGSGLAIRQKALPNDKPFERLPPTVVDATVTTVAFRYLRESDRAWTKRWDADKEKVLPVAVEVTLTIARGARAVEHPPLLILLPATAP